jgi:hypothetical protein
VTAGAATVTPAVAPDRLAAARASTDPVLGRWGAARAAREAPDLAEALAAAELAGHAARDRVLDRIAASGATACAPAVRALVDPAAACGAPVRTLLALRDREAVVLAAQWLARRRASDAEDVAHVVSALLAEGSEAALAEARRARDGRLLDRQAPLLLPFQVLASTGAAADAEAVVTAWLQAPPARWQGEEALAALLAECGVAAVPVSWFAAERRVPEFLRLLADSTDAPLDACLPEADRRDLVRHWQKRHWQEVLARLARATDDGHVPAALRALAGAIRARHDALARLDADDAGDLVMVLLAAALVSRVPAADPAALDAAAVAAALARPVRRIDPRVTRALLDRAEALGADMLAPLEAVVREHPGEAGAGLAVAALLRAPFPGRVGPLFRAAQTPLPNTLLGAVLDDLARAGAHALPVLREALADPAAAPTSPTPAVMALIEGAPFAETATLLAPLLPRWLARAKQRTLALCAVLAHPALLPALTDDWVEGEHAEGDVIRLLALLHGDEALAARHPPRAPERPSALRGPDGRPLPPPLRLLLRCVDCEHGYYYEVREVRVTDAGARFVEEDGPPGPPPGLALSEPIRCKRCGAVDRYRFTVEAMQQIRDAMQAEMLMAMEAEMRARQRAAAPAPDREQPPRLSPGGIILP